LSNLSSFSDTSVKVPKPSVAPKISTLNSGINDKSSSPSTSVPKTSAVLKNPSREGNSQNGATSLANQPSKNNGVTDAEIQASTSASTSRPVNTNALLVNPKQVSMRVVFSCSFS